MSKRTQIFLFIFSNNMTARNEVRVRDGKQFKSDVIQTGKKHQRNPKGPNEMVAVEN